ncbi:MAG TPA: sugar-transfer associated ATP-grasp domain-containing protein [Opitutus sp.]|nr:sugar-transfer associated ATP-grasp domain-containing protein [Opitutus sp.]
MNFVQQDRRFGSGTNLALLKRGFFSERALLYPFDRYDPRWFVNDWAIEHRFQTINPSDVSIQLRNKFFLHLLLRELGYGDRTAPLVGVLTDGRFSSFSPYRKLGDAIAAHGGVMAKPIAGASGLGVVRLGADDPVPPRGMFVVEGVLRQHAYAAAVFSGSVNTIRVVTMRLGDKEPFIPAAAHRFGGKKSAPVDNFGRGGVSALVDLETGELSSGRSKLHVHASTFHPVHPDTGVAVKGTTVPMWDEVKAFALELMKAIPGLQIAGWDICVTPDGPRLIEGNGGVPSADLIQVHRPMLLDRRTREFFRAKRVISQQHFDELERMAAAGLERSDLG